MSTISIILNGLLLGLIISLSFGPSSFALIQIGMQREFKYGIYMSIGVLLSDLTIIIIGYYSIGKNLLLEKYRLTIGILGGIVLISYGLFSFIRKTTNVENKQLEKKNNFISKLIGSNVGTPKYFLKGYFLNIFNLITITFWIASIVFISSRVDNIKDILLFLGCCFAVFVFNLIKVFLGTKIKKIPNTKFVNIINKVIGLILLIAGISLIVISIYNLHINSFPFT